MNEERVGSSLLALSYLFKMCFCDKKRYNKEKLPLQMSTFYEYQNLERKIYLEVNVMELGEIRNELEKTAKRLADFRGSL